MSKKVRSKRTKNDMEIPVVPKDITDRSPIVYQKSKLRNELHIFHRPLTPNQQAFLDMALDKNVKMILVSGPAGTAKAQPLDSDIITPIGIVKMANIKVGDSVFGEDGKPHEVVGVFPQGKRNVVRITFSDGVSTECCEDHLWETCTDADRNNRIKVNGKRIFSPRIGSVKSTREIMNSLIGKRGRINHTIPITSPVEFSSMPHVISPYIFGVLLGDGCFRSGSTIRFSSVDSDIIDRVKSECPPDVEVGHVDGCDYCLKMAQKSSKSNSNTIFSELNRLGLIEKYSHEKFIPTEYLFDNVENRLNLLRGLMDTDGTVDKRGTGTSFCSTSEHLIHDVSWIVQSLGGVCGKPTSYKSSYVKNGVRVYGKIAHRISIKLPPETNPFYLRRKSDRVVPKSRYVPKRYIVDIQPIGSKDCQCILVDSCRHLYLTNDFIVTHNTYLSVLAALELLNQKKMSDIVYVRSVVESADCKMGFLPGEAGDKFSPYLRPLMDKLEEFLPSDEIKYLDGENRLEGLPIGYLRGLNWNAKVIIGDEAQNMTKKELVTLMTRVGEFSKIFLIGDPSQADINGRSGFQTIFDLFGDSDSRENGIYTFQFTEDDIVRSKLVQFIAKKVKILV